MVAVAAGVGGCADISAINEARQDRRAFSFSGTKLTIDNDEGDLRLVAGKAGSVDVERSLTGKATLDGNATWSLGGGTLRLTVVCSGLVPDCGGRHIVHVPPGVALTVVSDGGPVRAVGLAADLTAEVAEGWLRVERPSGTLRLRAENDVEVTGARSADVSATSTDRDVALTFTGAPGRVEARAGNGSVSVTLPEGPETYRITGNPKNPSGDDKDASDDPGGVGPSDLRSDPASRRTVVVAAGRDVRVRKGR
ncbi:DUF4097 family beta strand repeat-containing protein [Sphaerisporangium corydalis]|uniref:Adhesin domain-containing protein n=1 Tax=Sphaerisporangium corydalis TaxID=1441875 RepID=A0ABV9EM34_9ACTN|nr:hypothetical protein [Sphaerisporangium corydalis]